MPPVNQDGQLNQLRSAVMEDRFDGGPGCAAGINDVIHDDQLFSCDFKRYFTFSGLREVAEFSQIVPVQADVHRAQGNLRAAEFLKVFLQHCGQRDAPPTDAQQAQVRDAAVFFNDFVGDPGHASANCGLIHNDGFQFHIVKESQGIRPDPL